MDIKGKIETIKAIEDELSKMVDELKSELNDFIKSQPCRYLRNDASNIFLVKLSELGGNWSPKYHSPIEQAKAVEWCLGKCHDMTSIEKAMSKIFEKGYVKMGNDEPVYLNDSTMKILIESELGVYVISGAINEIIGFLALTIAVRYGRILT